LPQTVSSQQQKLKTLLCNGSVELMKLVAPQNPHWILDGVANNIDQVATAAGVLVAVGAARYFGKYGIGARSATLGLLIAAKAKLL
jgi:phage-related minor tail protein